MEYRIVEIDREDLTATDLRSETEGQECEVARVEIDYANANPMEAVYLPHAGRVGICWGGDSDWTTADSLEEGVRLYLMQPDEFAARN